MNDDIAIQATGLRKRYGQTLAVDGICFSVARGECFGFLGPNGAGKTTTMKMLYGACAVTEGRLQVLGRDVSTDSREIKRRLGVVPQDDNLDTEVSVLENLLVFARYFSIPQKEARVRALELLEFFQLGEKRDQKVEALSGGMKRRLITARALIARPELIVLDEPTTGLDPAARHLLWEKLKQLQREGTTLVLTTHYMDEAERLCNRLVVIDGGRIIVEGTPAALIAEHVGRDVLELVVLDERQEELVRAIGTENGRVERLPDRVLCYPPDGKATESRLRAQGIPLESSRLRHAGLEDVFLRLTGRRLSD
jgi:lipooligosaccharide transport system ATP-binding protein